MNRSDQLSAAETNGGAGTLAVGTSYRIGDWEFDLGAQTLVREGEARPLMPKVARLLEHLAATAPDPLTRDQLIDLLWPGADVSDHALHELVSQLRKQLGDDARAPRYLATLSRRGYRLIAPVTTPGRESAPRGSVPSDRTIAIGAINTTGTTGPLSHDPAPPTPAAASVADLLTDRFVRFPELRLTPAAGDNRPASAAYELLGQLDRSDGGLHGHFQLVRTSDQHRVWTETFSTADDGPAGLADLATQVARRARLRLVCDRQCQLLRARAISIEAADLTCSAVAMNYRINQQGMFDPELMRAQAARAVQLDPGLLEAWQMLPTAYLWLGHSPGLTISEAAARSHEALDEALRLNPDDAYT